MIAAWSVLAQVAVAATPATVAGLPSAESDGIGASLPFTEYEAENARSNGTLIGPDRRFGSLAAEASGRRAIRLDRVGQSIDLVLAAPANAITVRYSLPDTADGRGQDSSLELVVGGRPIATLPTTSKFGWFYGKYPFSNDPGRGGAHHFWDEARVLLPRTLPAGTQLSIRRPENDKTAWTAIDLVDAELAAPPLPAGAGAISVIDFGADPTGQRSARAAFIAAIAAAQRTQKPLYVPPGRFRIDGHLEVDRVTINGAGPWHSLLDGKGLGICSRASRDGSSRVVLSGVAIESDVKERQDKLPLAAICGTFSQSTFSDLFLHHAKVGVWIDGPAGDLTLRRLRITDHTADGINLDRGIVSALIEQNFVRNTGDDGIALWSEKHFNARITIRNNTVIAPILANGIALYGGRDLDVSRNLVADSVTEGGGIHLGTRFKSTPFAGSITLSGNMIVRSGSLDPHWKFGVGALWFYALERPIRAAQITIRDTRITGSSCEAVQFLGPLSIDGVAIDRLDAANSGDTPMAIQASGSAMLRSVVNSNAAAPATIMVPDGFRMTDGGGNRGWVTAGVPRPAQPKCLSFEGHGEPAFP